MINISIRDGVINKRAIEEKYWIYTLFGKKYLISGSVKNFGVKNYGEFVQMCYLYGNEIIKMEEKGASIFCFLIHKNAKFFAKFSE